MGFAKGFLPKKYELLGWVLIGFGVMLVSKQAIEDHENEKIWADAAEAEREVEERLRNQ
jgi:hypothetical protein